MMDRIIRSLMEKKVLLLAGDIIPVISPLSVLAPREESTGFHLGIDERGRDIFLNPEKLPNMHGVILGTSGSGKSTLARHLILEARESGVKTWVIDPHGEEAYARLFTRRLIITSDRIDLLTATGWDLLEYAGELGRYVELIYGLRGARNVIREIIAECLREQSLEPFKKLANGDPDLERLFDDISRLHGNDYRITELAEQDVYFTLPLMASRELVAFATQVLLLLLHGYMRARGARQRLEMVVVLEEAHVHSPYLLSLFKEVRKWGYGVIAISQLPREFDPRVFQLAGFVIILAGPESYVRDVESLFSLTADERDHVLFSTRGAALFYRQGDPRPRKVFLKLRQAALA
ncbi:ATP-binding protein [Infirmifilum sp. NZ]|uniref:ATP-binding protein n=1 Tax=Infirmifilum sp. NZ TaxID=2926850 RepID=UPI00279D4101|nr:ATP-binding protein [Infirmifilum sp. NZ]UNQ72733.1 ATP-binding protein [Infirmifilum sp. NZ]